MHTGSGQHGQADSSARAERAKARIGGGLSCVYGYMQGVTRGCVVEQFPNRGSWVPIDDAPEPSASASASTSTPEAKAQALQRRKTFVSERARASAADSQQESQGSMDDAHLFDAMTTAGLFENFFGSESDTEFPSFNIMRDVHQEHCHHCIRRLHEHWRASEVNRGVSRGPSAHGQHGPWIGVGDRRREGGIGQAVRPSSEWRGAGTDGRLARSIGR